MPFNFNYGGIINTGQVKGVIDPVDPQDAATKKYVDELRTYLHDTDTELAGKVFVDGTQIAIQQTADSEIQWYILNDSIEGAMLKDGAVIAGKIADDAVNIGNLDSTVTIAALPPVDQDLTMNGFKIVSLADPESGGEAANMRYVDQEISDLDTELTTLINNEVAALEQKDTDNFNSLTNTINQVDSDLNARIDSEAVVRANADATLTDDLSEETMQRMAEDAILLDLINQGLPDRNIYNPLPLDQAADSNFTYGNIINLDIDTFAFSSNVQETGVFLWNKQSLDTEFLESTYSGGDYLRVTNPNDSEEYWTLSIINIQDTDVILPSETVNLFAIHVNRHPILHGTNASNPITQGNLNNGDTEWIFEIAHSGTVQINTLDSDVSGIVRHAPPGEGNATRYLGGDGMWHRLTTYNDSDFNTVANELSIESNKWATREYVQTNHNLDGVIGDSETGVVATDPGLSTPTIQISIDTDIIATKAFVENRPSGYEGNIGFGLDTDGGILTVDTEEIASRAYVDNMPSGYQGSIGYGLDTDGGILKVDTDEIADTAWVNANFGADIRTGTQPLTNYTTIELHNAGGNILTTIALENTDTIDISHSGSTVSIDVDTDVIADTDWVKDYIHTHGQDSDSLSYFKANSHNDPARATGDDAIAIGEESLASASEAIAIGKHAGATAPNSIHIGSDNSIGGGVDPESNRGIAIGRGASVFGNSADSIALGTDTTLTNVPNVMAVSPDIDRIVTQSTTYDDTDTELLVGHSLARGSFVKSHVAQEINANVHDGGLIAGTGLEYTGAGQFGANSNTNHTLNVDTDVIATQTYVNTHAGVITDTDISAGYGINVRQVTEGGQEHTEINVDTDVIANRTYVDNHVGGNANLEAGTGLRKVNDTELAVDTEATSNGFPIEGKGTDTLFIDSLFGYRIKSFDTVNNRILFEVFDLDGEQSRSVTWSPTATPGWDVPLSQVQVSFTNQANLNDPFLDKIVSWSVGGNALTLPANKSAYAATQTFTAALTDANSRDDSVISTWSGNGQGGSKEFRYQYGGSNGATSNEYTSTANWGDLTASLASTSLTASQRFDVIRQSFTARLGYNTAADTDNVRAITITTVIDDTTDSESYDKDTDTDANPFNSGFQSNNAQYTFTGTTIYYDSTVSLSGTGKFRRPTTVMNGTEAQRTREINVTGSTNRTTVYPTWLTQVSDVEQAFDTDAALGSLGVNGYATSANRTDTSTTGWRGRTYTSTQAGADGGTLFLIVPSQARTGFRNPDNLSLNITPVINGDSITIGHSGHTVTYYVYSFNIQPNTTLAVQEYN